jgi:hypothetical protein
MSFKKTVISSIAAAAVATTAFGAVNVSLNNKGDYLNYPAYYATTDGWSTNIRVVNTNTTSAVVAKVVVREYATSKELLDFPIYLSPGDVWTADLINKGATVNVVSSDDSSPEVPMDQPLNNNNPLVGTTHGYVEILAIGQADAAAIQTAVGTSGWEEFKKLPKADIKKAFTWDMIVANPTLWGTPTEDLFGQQVVTDMTTGSEKSMTLMAPAIEVVDADDNMLWTASEVAFNNLFAGNTTPNTMWYATVEDDIRVAIRKTAVHTINYVNGVGETQVLLTQAYKHTNTTVDTDGAVVVGVGDDVPLYDTSATQKAATGSEALFYFTGRAWDNEELTYVPEDTIYSGSDRETVAQQCPTEICYLYTSDDANYASGWVNYTLATTANGHATADSIATLHTVMTGVKVNGNGIVNMLSGAYVPAENN